MVPLEYLNNSWRALEMQLINYEFDIFLTWSGECVIVTRGNYGKRKPKCTITDSRLYVSVVTLSAQDNYKLL